MERVRNVRFQFSGVAEVADKQSFHVKNENFQFHQVLGFLTEQFIE